MHFFLHHAMAYVLGVAWPSKERGQLQVLYVTQSRTCSWLNWARTWCQGHYAVVFKTTWSIGLGQNRFYLVQCVDTFNFPKFPPIFLKSGRGYILARPVGRLLWEWKKQSRFVMLIAVQLTFDKRISDCVDLNSAYGCVCIFTLINNLVHSFILAVTSFQQIVREHWPVTSTYVPNDLMILSTAWWYLYHSSSDIGGHQEPVGMKTTS